VRSRSRLIYSSSMVMLQSARRHVKVPHCPVALALGGGVQITTGEGKLRCIESDEVRLRWAHSLRQGHHGGCALAVLASGRLWPTRYSATSMIVRYASGGASSLEQAVSAVPRNEHRLHAGSDRAGLSVSEGGDAESATQAGSRE